MGSKQLSIGQIRCVYGASKSCGNPIKILDFGFVSHYHGEPNLLRHIGAGKVHAMLKQGFGYALPKEVHMLFSSLSKFP